MKNKILAISALAIVSLLFAGCGGTKDDTPKEVSKSDAVLDQVIFDQAVEAQNNEKCQEITSSQAKKECEDTVLSLDLTAKAKAGVDLDICSQIPLEHYQKNCVQVVTDLEAALHENEKITEISTNALEKLDTQICNDINDANKKDECLLDIYSDPNYPSKDIKVCDNIHNPALQEACISSLTVTKQDQSKPLAP